MLDPIGTLATFFTNLATTFTSWYTDAVKSTIAFLMSSSLPSQEEINSDFFKLNFGGTIGLANWLVSGVALLVLLAFLITPRRDHGIKISRFITSLVGLVVYAVLFYRFYSYVDNASKGLMQFALNFITNSKNGTVDQINSMLGLGTPSAVGSVVVLGIFSVIFCWFAAAIAFCLKMVVVLILILYPVLIVLRPIGNVAVLAFNAANSFLVVAVLSPIIMVWAITLPIVARNIIPGADAIGLTTIITLVCSAGALLTPLVLLVIFFRLSSQVFGHIDTQGNTVVDSLPPLTWDEAQRDMQDNRLSPIKDAFPGIVEKAFESGGVKSLIDSIPDTLVNLGATAAAVEFGPLAGTIIKGAHEKFKEHMASSREKASKTSDEPLVMTDERESNE